MQTVREYLTTNRNINGVHMMTPYGYVDLSSEQITTLLDNSKNGELDTHFGFGGMGCKLSTDALLSQVICTDINTLEDGSTSFLTDEV